MTEVPDYLLRPESSAEDVTIDFHVNHHSPGQYSSGLVWVGSVFGDPNCTWCRGDIAKLYLRTTDPTVLAEAREWITDHWPKDVKK